MTDIIDDANDHRDKEEARCIKAVRDEAAKMQTGTPGDCDFCGEWTSRLVGGACAPCRDARGLP